ASSTPSSRPGRTGWSPSWRRGSTRSGPSTGCRSWATPSKTPAVRTPRYWRTAAGRGRTHAAAGSSTAPWGERSRLTPPSLLQQEQQDGLLQLLRREAERAATALVDDLARLVDEVEPVRHAAVGVADAVVDPVDDERDGHLQRLRALAGDGAALLGR